MTCALVCGLLLVVGCLRGRELASYPEGEIKEMVELYEKLGVSREDADVVIRTLSKWVALHAPVLSPHVLRVQ